MAISRPQTAYVVNNARLNAANYYARPALGPYFPGMNVGYARRNANKQFEDSLRRMATSPFSVNSESYMEQIREQYGIGNEARYNAMGTIGGIVGAGMAVAGTFVVKKVVTDASGNIVRNAKGLPQTKLGFGSRAVERRRAGTGITRPLNANQKALVEGYRNAKTSLDTAQTTLESATTAFNTTSDAVKAQQAVVDTAQEAFDTLKKNGVKHQTKAYRQARKTLMDAQADLTQKVALETTERVAKEAAEESVEQLSKQAAKFSDDLVMSGVKNVDQVAGTVGRKLSGLVPYAGMAADVASLGFSTADFVQNIKAGDTAGAIMSGIEVFGDALAVTGDVISLTGVGAIVGEAISMVGTIISTAMSAIRIGFNVGQTVGHSLTPEGLKAQQLFAENLYANMTNRPVSTVAGMMVQFGIPAALGAMGRGYADRQTRTLMRQSGMKFNVIGNVFRAVPHFLTENALGNQLRATTTMMGQQLLSPVTRKIDEALIPNTPESADYVSAISLFGDIQDNLYGATHKKSILLGLVSDDPYAKTNALARAWGRSDDPAYALNFSDVLEETFISKAPVAVKSVLGVLGEIFIDPQNYKEMESDIIKARLTDSIKQGVLGRLHRADILNAVQDNKYGILVGQNGIFRDAKVLTASIQKLMDGDVKGFNDVIRKSAISNTRGGGKIDMTDRTLDQQSKLFIELYTDVISGGDAVRTNNMTDAEIAKELKRRQADVDDYAKSKQPPQGYNRNTIGAMKRTLDNVKMRYGSDDYDKIAIKMIQDFNLKLNTDNVRDFYLNSSTFRAYMDFIGDANKVMLAMINPLGKLTQTVLQKGQTGLIQLLSKGRANASLPNRMRAVASYKQAIDTLRNNAPTQAEMEAAEARIKAKHAVELKTTEQFGALGQPKANVNDRIIADDILEKINQDPIIQELTATFDDDKVTYDDLTTKIDEALSELERASSFTMAGLTYTPKGGGKPVSINDDNIEDIRRLYINDFEKDGDRQLTHQEILTKRDRGVARGDQQAIDYKRFKDLVIDYELMTERSALLKEVYLAYRQVIVLLNSQSTALQDKLINTLQSLHTFKRYVNTISNEQDALKYHSDRKVTYERAVKRYNETLESLNTETTKIADRIAEYSKGKSKKALELLGEDTTSDYYQLLKKQKEIDDDLKTTTDKLNDVIIELNNTNKTVAYWQARKDAGQSTKSKNVQRYRVFDTKLNREIFKAIKADSTAELEANKDLILDHIDLAIINGHEVTLSYLDTDGAIKTININSANRTSDEVRYVVTSGVKMTNVSLVFNDTPEIVINTILNTYTRTDIFSAVEHYDHPLYKMTPEQWKALDTKERKKAILSFINKAPISDADKKRLMEQRDTVFYDINRTMEQGETKRRVLVDDLDARTLQRYVMQQSLNKRGGQVAVGSMAETMKIVAETITKIETSIREALKTTDDDVIDMDESLNLSDKAQVEKEIGSLRDLLERQFRRTPVYEFVKSYLYRNYTQDGTELKLFMRPEAMYEELPRISDDDIKKSSKNLEMSEKLIMDYLDTPFINIVNQVRDNDDPTTHELRELQREGQGEIQDTDTPEQRAKKTEWNERVHELEQERNEHRNNKENVIDKVDIGVGDSEYISREVYGKVFSDALDPISLSLSNSIDGKDIPRSIINLISSKPNNYVKHFVVNFTSISFIRGTDGSLVSVEAYLKERGIGALEMDERYKVAAEQITALLLNYKDKLQLEGITVKQNKGESMTAAYIRTLVEHLKSTSKPLKLRINLDSDGRQKYRYTKTYNHYLRRNFINNVRRYMRNTLMLPKFDDQSVLDFIKKNINASEANRDKPIYNKLFDLYRESSDIALRDMSNAERLPFVKTLKDIATVNINYAEKLKASLDNKTLTLRADVRKQQLLDVREIDIILNDLVNASETTEANHVLFKLLKEIRTSITEDYAHKRQLTFDNFDSIAIENGEIVFKDGTETIDLFSIIYKYQVSINTFKKFVTFVSNKMLASGVDAKRVGDLIAQVSTEYNSTIETYEQFLTHNTLEIAEDVFMKMELKDGDGNLYTDKQKQTIYNLMVNPNNQRLYNSLKLSEGVLSSHRDLKDNTRKFRIQDQHSSRVIKILKSVLEKTNKKIPDTLKDPNGVGLDVDISGDNNAKFLMAILMSKQLTRQEKYNIVKPIFFYDVKEAKGKANDHNIQYMQGRLGDAEKDLKEFIATKPDKNDQVVKRKMQLKEQEVLKWKEQLQYYNEIRETFDVDTPSLKSDAGFSAFFKTYLDIGEDYTGTIDLYNVVRMYRATEKTIDESKYVMALDPDTGKYHLVYKTRDLQYEGLEGVPALNSFLINNVLKSKVNTAKAVQDKIKDSDNWKTFSENNGATIKHVSAGGNALIVLGRKADGTDHPKQYTDTMMKQIQFDMNKDDYAVNSVFVVTATEYEQLVAMQKSGKTIKNYFVPLVQKDANGKIMNMLPPVINVKSSKAIVDAFVSDLVFLDSLYGDKVDKHLVTYNNFLNRKNSITRDNPDFTVPRKSYDVGVDLFNTQTFRKMQDQAKAALLLKDFWTMIQAGRPNERLNMEHIAGLLLQDKFIREKTGDGKFVIDLNELEKHLDPFFVNALNEEGLMTVVKSTLQKLRDKYSDTVFDINYSQILSKEFIGNLNNLYTFVYKFVNQVKKTNNKLYDKIVSKLADQQEREISDVTKVREVNQQFKAIALYDKNTDADKKAFDNIYGINETELKQFVEDYSKRKNKKKKGYSEAQAQKYMKEAVNKYFRNKYKDHYRKMRNQGKLSLSYTKFTEVRKAFLDYLPANSPMTRDELATHVSKVLGIKKDQNLYSLARNIYDNMSMDKRTQYKSVDEVYNSITQNYIILNYLVSIQQNTLKHDAKGMFQDILEDQLLNGVVVRINAKYKARLEELAKAGITDTANDKEIQALVALAQKFSDVNAALDARGVKLPTKDIFKPSMRNRNLYLNASSKIQGLQEFVKPLDEEAFERYDLSEEYTISQGLGMYLESTFGYSGVSNDDQLKFIEFADQYIDNVEYAIYSRDGEVPADFSVVAPRESDVDDLLNRYVNEPDKQAVIRILVNYTKGKGGNIYTPEVAEVFKIPNITEYFGYDIFKELQKAIKEDDITKAISKTEYLNVRDIITVNMNNILNSDKNFFTFFKQQLLSTGVKGVGRDFNQYKKYMFELFGINDEIAISIADKDAVNAIQDMGHLLNTLKYNTSEDTRTMNKALLFMNYVNYLKSKYYTNKYDDKNLTDADPNKVYTMIEAPRNAAKAAYREMYDVNIIGRLNKGSSVTNSLGYDMSVGFDTIRAIEERTGFLNSRLNRIISTDVTDTPEDHKTVKSGYVTQVNNRAFKIAQSVQNDLYKPLYVSDSSNIFTYKHQQIRLSRNDVVLDIMAENKAMSVDTVGSTHIIFNDIRKTFTDVLEKLLTKSQDGFRAHKFVRVRDVTNALRQFAFDKAYINYFATMFDEDLLSAATKFMQASGATDDEVKTYIDETNALVLEVTKLFNGQHGLVALSDVAVKAVLGYIHFQKHTTADQFGKIQKGMLQYAEEILEGNIKYTQANLNFIDKQLKNIINDPTLQGKAKFNKIVDFYMNIPNAGNLKRADVAAELRPLFEMFNVTRSYTLKTERLYDTFEASVEYQTPSLVERTVMGRALEDTRNEIKLLTTQIERIKSNRKGSLTTLTKGFVDALAMPDTYDANGKLIKGLNMGASATPTITEIEHGLNKAIEHVTREYDRLKGEQDASKILDTEKTLTFIKTLFNHTPLLKSLYYEKLLEELNLSKAKKEKVLETLNAKKSPQLVKAYDEYIRLHTLREKTVKDPAFNLLKLLGTPTKENYIAFKDELDLHNISENDFMSGAALKVFIDIMSSTTKLDEKMRKKFQLTKKGEAYDIPVRMWNKYKTDRESLGKPLEAIDKKIYALENQFTNVEDFLEDPETQQAMFDLYKTVMKDYLKALDKEGSKLTIKELANNPQHRALTDTEVKYATNKIDEEEKHLYNKIKQLYNWIRNFNEMNGHTLKPLKGDDITDYIRDIKREVKVYGEILVVLQNRVASLDPSLTKRRKYPTISRDLVSGEMLSDYSREVLLDYLVTLKTTVSGTRPGATTKTQDEIRKQTLAQYGSSNYDTLNKTIMNYLHIGLLNVREGKSISTLLSHQPDVNVLLRNFMTKLGIKDMPAEAVAALESYTEAMLHNLKYEVNTITSNSLKKAIKGIESNTRTLASILDTRADLVKAKAKLKSGKTIVVSDADHMIKVFNNLFSETLNIDATVEMVNTVLTDTKTKGVSGTTRKYKEAAEKYNAKLKSLRSTRDNLQKHITTGEGSYVKELADADKRLNELKETETKQENKLKTTINVSRNLYGKSSKNKDLFKHYYEKETQIQLTTDEQVVNAVKQEMIDRGYITREKLEEAIKYAGGEELHNSAVDTLVTLYNYHYQTGGRKEVAVVDMETITVRGERVPYAITLSKLDKNGKLDIYTVYINNSVFYNFKEAKSTWSQEIENFYAQQYEIWKDNDPSLTEDEAVKKFVSLVKRVSSIKNTNTFVQGLFSVFSPTAKFDLVAHNGARFDFGLLNTFVANTSTRLMLNRYYDQLRDVHDIDSVVARVQEANVDKSADELDVEYIKELQKLANELRDKLSNEVQTIGEGEHFINRAELDIYHETYTKVNKKLLELTLKREVRTIYEDSEYIIDEDLRESILKSETGPVNEALTLLYSIAVDGKLEARDALITLFNRAFVGDPDKHDMVVDYVDSLIKNVKDKYERLIEGIDKVDVYTGGESVISKVNEQIKTIVNQNGDPTSEFDIVEKIKSLDVQIENLEQLKVMLKSGASKTAVVKEMSQQLTQMNQEVQDLTDSVKSLEGEINKAYVDAEAVAYDKIRNASKRIQQQIDNYGSKIASQLNAIKGMTTILRNNDYLRNQILSTENFIKSNQIILNKLVNKLDALTRVLNGGQLAVIRSDKSLSEAEKAEAIKQLLVDTKVLGDTLELLNNKDKTIAMIKDRKQRIAKYNPSKPDTELLKHYITVARENLEARRLAEVNTFKIEWDLRKRDAGFKDLMFNSNKLTPEILETILYTLQKTHSNDPKYLKLAQLVNKQSELYKLTEVSLLDDAAFITASGLDTTIPRELERLLEVDQNTLELLNKYDNKNTELAKDILVSTAQELFSTIDSSYKMMDSYKSQTLVTHILGVERTKDMDPDRYTEVASSTVDIKDFLETNTQYKQLGLEVAYDDPERGDDVQAVFYNHKKIFTKTTTVDVPDGKLDIHTYQTFDNNHGTTNTMTVIDNSVTFDLSYGYNTVLEPFGKPHIARTKFTVKLNDTKRVRALLTQFYDQYGTKNINEEHIIGQHVYKDAIMLSDFYGGVPRDTGYDSIKLLLDFYIEQSADKTLKNAPSKISSDLLKDGESLKADNDTLEVINLTESKLMKALYYHIQINNDVLQNKNELRAAYAKIYNKVFGKYKGLERNSMLNLLSPDFDSNYIITSYDPDWLDKHNIELGLSSEGSSGVTFKYRTKAYADLPFVRNVNTVRTQLSYKHLFARFTPVKLMNKLFKATGENTEKYKRHEIQKALTELMDTDADARKVLGLAGSLLNKRDGDGNVTDSFKPSVNTKEFNTKFQKDEVHSFGMNVPVVFAKGHPGAVLDAMLIDEDFANSIGYGDGWKTWVGLHYGFKGAVRTFKGLYEQTGGVILADAASIEGRGTSGIEAEMLYNTLRSYHLKETYEIDGVRRNVLTDTQISILDTFKAKKPDKYKRLIEGVINKDNNVIEYHPFADDYEELIKELPNWRELITGEYNKVNGEYPKLTYPIVKERKGVTYTKGDPYADYNKILEQTDTMFDTAEGNRGKRFIRGTVYILADNEHTTESAQTKAKVNEVGDIVYTHIDNSNSVAKGLPVSPTVVLALQGKIGRDWEKVFKPISDNKAYIGMIHAQGENYANRVLNITDISKLTLKDVGEMYANVDDIIAPIPKGLQDMVKAYLTQYIGLLEDYTQHSSDQSYVTYFDNRHTAITSNFLSKLQVKLADGNASDNYRVMFRRHLGVRQQYLADSQLKVGEMITSKEAWDYIKKQGKSYMRTQDAPADVIKQIKALQQAKDWGNLVTYLREHGIDENQWSFKETSNARLDYIKEVTEVTFKGEVADLKQTYAYLLGARSPVQDVGAVPVFKVIGYTSGNAARLSPYIYTMMGADNDGDTVGLGLSDYNDVENSDGPLKDLLATDYNYYTPDFKGDKHYLLEQNNEISKGLKLKDMVDEDIISLDSTRNYTGKRTFVNGARYDKSYAHIEDIRQIDTGMYNKILKNTKATKSIANIKDVDMRLKVMRKYLNVYSRMNFSKDQDYFGDIKKYGDIYTTEDTERLKEVVALYNNYKEIIDKYYTLDEGIKANTIVKGRDLVIPKELGEKYYKLLDDDTVELLKNPDNSEASVRAQRILYNLVHYKIHSAGSVIRIQVSKRGVNFAGDKRKEQMISSMLSTYRTINRSQNDKFWKQNNMVDAEGNTTVETAFEGMIPNKDTRIILEAHARAGREKEFKDGVRKNASTQFKADEPILAQDKEALVHDIYEAYYKAEQVAIELQALKKLIPFSSVVNKQGINQVVTIKEVMTFLQTSSKKDDPYIKSFVKVWTDGIADNSIKETDYVPKDFLWYITASYFNASASYIEKFLKNATNKSIKEMANGYVQQYILTRTTIKTLSDEMSRIIAVAKHFGYDINSIEFYNEFREYFSARTIGMAKRKVNYGVDNNEYIYGSSIAADRSILVKLGAEWKNPKVAENRKEYFKNNPSVQIRTDFRDINDAKSYMGELYRDVMQQLFYGNMRPPVVLMNRLESDIVKLNGLLTNPKDLTQNVTALKEVVLSLTKQNIPLYKLGIMYDALLARFNFVNTYLIKSTGSGMRTNDVNGLNIFKNAINLINTINYYYGDTTNLKDLRKMLKNEPLLLNFFTNANEIDPNLYIPSEDGGAITRQMDVDGEQVHSDNVNSNIANIVESESSTPAYNGTPSDSAVNVIKSATRYAVAEDFPDLLQSSRSIDEVLYNLREEIEQTIVSQNYLQDRSEEQSAQLKKAPERSSQTLIFEELNRVTGGLTQYRKISKYLDDIREAHNQYQELLRTVPDKEKRIRIINQQIIDMNKAIQVLQDARTYQKNSDAVKQVDADIETLKEQLVKYKKQLVQHSFYKEAGNGLLFLRNEKNQGIADATIVKPRYLTQNELDDFKDRQTLEMAHNIYSLHNVIPQYSDPKRYKEALADLLRFIKESGMEYRLVMLLPPDDDEGLYRQVFNRIYKYDENQEYRSTVEDNQRFKTLKDLEDFAASVEGKQTKVVFDGKTYAGIDPDLIFANNKYLTPTLKEIPVKTVEQLQELHEKSLTGGAIIGFVDLNTMMRTMNQTYYSYKMTGPFNKTIGKLQRLSKNLSKFSSGFLFRNLMDTGYQIFTKAHERLGIGGMAENAPELGRLLLNSNRIYDVYKYIAEERMITQVIMHKHVEDLLLYADKGQQGSDEFKNKVAEIQKFLQTYLDVANSADAPQNMQKRIPTVEHLMHQWSQVTDKTHKVALKQYATRTKDFSLSLKFSEYLELHDKYNPNSKIADRFKENMMDIKDREFKGLLKHISAFMETEALNDFFRDDSYDKLRAAMLNYKDNPDNVVWNTRNDAMKYINNHKGFKDKLIRGLKSPLTAYDNANTYIENIARITSYLYATSLYNENFGEATLSSLKQWFNYGSRSPLEYQLMADMPFISFPVRTVNNWIDRINDPKYWRFMSDFIDGWYGQYLNEEKEYDEYMKFQIRNGWIPLSSKFGIRVGNGSFDVLNIIYGTTEQIEQRQAPISRAVLTMMQTGDATEAFTQLATSSTVVRGINALTGGVDLLAGTNTRQQAQQLPVVGGKVSTRQASIGNINSVLYDTGSSYDGYSKYTPKRYRVNNARYTRYENVYKDWFNKYGKMRKPRVDPLSLVKDIQWRHYVRWRRHTNR